MEKISEAVEHKIIQHIRELNFKNIRQQFPKAGNSFIEANFKLGMNEKSDKYAFVVSEKFTYYNGSQKDRRYQIYAFDKTTGDLVPDFEKNGGCYYGFFNDLKIVQDIV